jgi:hypothetical protein
MKWTKKPLAEVADFCLGKMLDDKKNRGEESLSLTLPMLMCAGVNSILRISARCGSSMTRWIVMG